MKAPRLHVAELLIIVVCACQTHDVVQYGQVGEYGMPARLNFERALFAAAAGIHKHQVATVEALLPALRPLARDKGVACNGVDEGLLHSVVHGGCRTAERPFRGGRMWLQCGQHRIIPVAWCRVAEYTRIHDHQ